MKPGYSRSLTLRSSLAALALLGTLGLLPAPAGLAQEALQSLDSIMQSAEQHARAELAGQQLTNVEVRANPLDTRLRLKTCEQPLETFSTTTTALRSGRATVGVRCSGSSPWTLYVPVSIAAQVAAVRLRGPLARGTLISTADVELVSAALASLPPNHLASIDQVVGRELQRSISTDTVVTLNMLLTRALISKGQGVSIVARGAKVEVRMAGTALQNGQQGDRISVKNTNSGRTIEAVVVSADTVSVQL